MDYFPRFTLMVMLSCQMHFGIEQKYIVGQRNLHLRNLIACPFCSNHCLCATWELFQNVHGALITQLDIIHILFVLFLLWYLWICGLNICYTAKCYCNLDWYSVQSVNRRLFTCSLLSAPPPSLCLLLLQLQTGCWPDFIYAMHFTY